MPSPTISTSAGCGEAHRAATAWTEHHLLRIDRRLAAAVAGEEGAVDRERRSVRAARHQRHHRRPDAARGMFQTGMEAQRRRGGRRGRARRDRSRPAFRSAGVADCQMASAASLRLASSRSGLRSTGVRRDARADEAGADRSPSTGRATAELAMTRVLVAAGMAAHEHLAVVRVA